jgi:hypothetical protein
MAKLGKPIIVAQDPTDRILKICVGSLVYDRTGKSWMCRNPAGDFESVSDKKVSLFFMQLGVSCGLNKFQQRLQKHEAFAVSDIREVPRCR